MWYDFTKTARAKGSAHCLTLHLGILRSYCSWIHIFSSETKNSMALCISLSGGILDSRRQMVCETSSYHIGNWVTQRRAGLSNDKEGVLIVKGTVYLRILFCANVASCYAPVLSNTGLYLCCETPLSSAHFCKEVVTSPGRQFPAFRYHKISKVIRNLDRTH